MTPTGMFSSEICFKWCNFCILAKTTIFDCFGGALVLPLIAFGQESLIVKIQWERIETSHASEPYIPIKPYRCPRNCALALYSLYSHFQALFSPIKPSFLAKKVHMNNICIIFMRILEIFFHTSSNSLTPLSQVHINTYVYMKFVLSKRVSHLRIAWNLPTSLGVLKFVRYMRHW